MLGSAGRPRRASTSTATSSPGSTDHIIPWENATARTQLLGGDVAVRALHQRPHPGARQPAGAGQPRRATGSPTTTRPTPEAWLEQAADAAGQLVARLRPLAGRALAATLVPAPEDSARSRARAKAPGSYVHATAESPCPTPTSATRSPPTTSASREQFTPEQWEHFIATRRFVDDEVLPVINDYWEAAELPWPLMRRLAELGLVRRGHRGLRLPGHEPARARAGEHGAAPRRRQPRHVPRRPVRAGDEVDRAARLRGAEGALAAGDGAAGQDRGVRAHRARARLGLGRAGDHRPPRRRRLGDRRRQALDRQRLDRRRRGGLGARRRRRPGQGLPRRDGHARLRRRDDRRQGRRCGRSGRPRSRSTASRPRRAAARRALVQGRRPRARHAPARTCAWAALGHAVAAYDAALTYSKQRVQFGKPLCSLPDRPGPAREDARRGHRHAALLHAARPARGGGPADRHDRRPGQAQQHPQGARR